MDYDGDDIYCDVIVPKKVPLNIVEETDYVLAYYHTKPSWPLHIVVTPKRHVESFLELSDTDPRTQRDLLEVVAKVASMVKAKQGACRILTNLGDYQDSKHLHFHIYFGKKLH